MAIIHSLNLIYLQYFLKSVFLFIACLDFLCKHKNYLQFSFFRNSEVMILTVSLTGRIFTDNFPGDVDYLTGVGRE